MSELTRAIARFDARAFVKKHGGRKESVSDKSHEYLLECPFCNGHNLRWNARKKLGTWICWNCKRTGDTLYLVMIFERVDREDAITYIMDGYIGGDARLSLSEIARMPEPITIERKQLQRLPQMKWPSMVARVTTRHATAMNYLIGRGISFDQIDQYNVGVGLSGRLKDYVVFPVYMDGGLVYWQGRATWNPPEGLSREGKKAWAEATGYRKTLNPFNPPKGIEQATAGEVIFNYDRALACPHVVITEGPVDAMKVGTHAVGLLGKGTDTKVERLRRMRAQRYTIYLDRGVLKTGQFKTEERERAEELAAELDGFAPVYIAVPPSGHDPGSLTPEQNARIVEAAEPYREIGLKSGLVP